MLIRPYPVTLNINLTFWIEFTTAISCNPLQTSFSISILTTSRIQKVPQVCINASGCNVQSRLVRSLIFWELSRFRTTIFNNKQWLVRVSLKKPKKTKKHDAIMLRLQEYVTHLHTKIFMSHVNNGQSCISVIRRLNLHGHCKIRDKL